MNIKEIHKIWWRMGVCPPPVERFFMDLFISDKCTKINTKKCEKFFKNILQD